MAARSAFTHALSWFPIAAFLLGLFGVTMARDTSSGLVSVGVMVVAMGLHLAGWRRRVLRSPGSLGAAVMVGALCVTVILAGSELYRGSADASTIARR